MDSLLFENAISLSQPVSSSCPTRWERKRSQQALSQSVNGGNAADRYIPNRSGTDFDLSFQAGAVSDDSLIAGDGDNSTSDYAKLLAANTNGKNFLKAPDIMSSSSGSRYLFCHVSSITWSSSKDVICIRIASSVWPCVLLFTLQQIAQFISH